MEFRQFEKEVNALVKDAFRDKTVHLKRYNDGELEVICAYVSPEYAGQGTMITHNGFSVGDYLDGHVNLREAFHYMTQEIEARLGE